MARPATKFNESDDAIIEIKLHMPGRTAIRDTVRVKSIYGKLFGSQKNPVNYMETIKSKLK